MKKYCHFSSEKVSYGGLQANWETSASILHYHNFLILVYTLLLTSQSAIRISFLKSGIFLFLFEYIVVCSLKGSLWDTSNEHTTIYGPAYDIMVLIAYALSHYLNTNVHGSSITACLIFGISLHFSILCVWEQQRLCWYHTGLSEPLLLIHALSSKLKCAGWGRNKKNYIVIWIVLCSFLKSFSFYLITFNLRKQQETYISSATCSLALAIKYF